MNFTSFAADVGVMGKRAVARRSVVKLTEPLIFNGPTALQLLHTSPPPTSRASVQCENIAGVAGHRQKFRLGRAHLPGRLSPVNIAAIKFSRCRQLA